MDHFYSFIWTSHTKNIDICLFYNHSVSLMLFGFYFLTGDIFLTRSPSPDYSALTSPSCPSTHKVEWHTSKVRFLGAPRNIFKTNSEVEVNKS